MYVYNDESFVLDIDDIKALVKGKFNVRKCIDCEGKGWFWTHEDGTPRNPTAEENHDDFYKHPCGDDECNGLGFFIVFDHNIE